MDPEAAARRWVDVWSTGWKEHDVGRIVAHYAQDATHYSAPFRDPTHGPDGVREYVEWAFAEEDDVEPHFGEPLISGDCAAVEWWTVITHRGREQTLAGVSMICFGEDGLVVEQRDYWHLEDGRRQAMPGWGFLAAERAP